MGLSVPQKPAVHSAVMPGRVILSSRPGANSPHRDETNADTIFGFAAISRHHSFGEELRAAHPPLTGAVPVLMKSDK